MVSFGFGTTGCGLSDSVSQQTNSEPADRSATTAQPESTTSSTSSTSPVLVVSTPPPTATTVNDRDRSGCISLGADGALTGEMLGKHTAIVGDSITKSANQELAETLPGITISAYQARTMATPLNTDDAVHVILSDPGILAGRSIRIIALGTNDVWGLQLTRDELHRDVQSLLELVGAGEGSDLLLVWVLPAMNEPIDEVTQDQLEWLNDVIRSEVNDRQCAFTVEWGTITAGRESELLQPDGVHLTEVGRVEFAKFVKHSLLELVE